MLVVDSFTLHPFDPNPYETGQGPKPVGTKRIPSQLGIQQAYSPQPTHFAHSSHETAAQNNNYKIMSCE